MNRCDGCGENHSDPIQIVVNMNGIKCLIDKNNNLGFFILDMSLTEYAKKNNLSFEKIKSLSPKERLFILEEIIGLREQEIRKEILDTYEEVKTRK